MAGALTSDGGPEIDALVVDPLTTAVLIDLLMDRPLPALDPPTLELSGWAVDRLARGAADAP
jgi:hypothetical protein